MSRKAACATMNRARSRSKIKRAARSDSSVEMRCASREGYSPLLGRGISHTWTSSPSGMEGLGRLDAGSMVDARQVAVHHLTQNACQDRDVRREEYGSMVAGNLV